MGEALHSPEPDPVTKTPEGVDTGLVDWSIEFEPTRGENMRTLPHLESGKLLPEIEAVPEEVYFDRRSEVKEQTTSPAQPSSPPIKPMTPIASILKDRVAVPLAPQPTVTQKPSLTASYATKRPYQRAILWGFVSGVGVITLAALNAIL